LESYGGRQYLCALESGAAVPLSGLPSVTHAEFSPDGRHIALGGKKGHVGIYLLDNGRCVAMWRHRGPVEALAYSHDGRFLATADRAVRVFDAERSTFVGEPIVHAKAVDALVWNKPADRLVVGCRDRKLRMYTFDDGGLKSPVVGAAPYGPMFTTMQRAEFAPAFVLDETSVVYPSGRQYSEGRLACVEAATGKLSWRPRATNVYSAAVASDGRFVFVGGDRDGAVLDARERGKIAGAIPHRHAIYSADYRPDARWLATGSWDRTVRIWSDRDSGPIAMLPHQAGVTCVQFAPSGELLATAQEDGVVKIWNVASREPRVRRFDAGTPAGLARISTDGRYVMPSGTSFPECSLKTLTAYEIAGGEAVGEQINVDGIVADAQFAPGVERAIAAVRLQNGKEAGASSPQAGAAAGRIQAWNLLSGKLLAESAALVAAPRSVTVSPDGSQVATFCEGGQLHVFDAATLATTWSATMRGNATKPYQYANNGVVRFAPDGRSVLLFGADYFVYVWDAATGKERFGPLAHEHFVHDVDVSADCETLVTASFEGAARFWNLATGKERAAPLPLPDRVFRARFVDGDTKLLTACRDNLVRIHDIKSREVSAPPAEHDEEVFDARLTPNGRWIVSVALDKTLRVASRRTGKLVIPPVQLDGGGWAVEITADGKYAVASGGGGTLTVLDLSDLDRKQPFDVDDAMRMAEFFSGHSVRDDRIDPLTSDQWMERFSQARRIRPELFDWPADAPGEPAARAMRVVPPRTPLVVLADEEFRRRLRPYVNAARQQIARARREVATMLSESWIGAP
jgi:WD40 repeat protein